MPSAQLIKAELGGVVAVGGTYGNDGQLYQAFLNGLNPASQGVVAMTVSTNQELDFRGFTGGLRLGAIGAVTYSGTFRPHEEVNGDVTYLLGGAGGTLTFISAVNDSEVSHGLDVGANGTAPGTVVLDGTSDWWTQGDFSLGVVVRDAMTLRLAEYGSGDARTLPELCDVTITGGAILDLGGAHNLVIASLGTVTLEDGSIINGGLKAAAVNVYQGTITAGLYGECKLTKSTSGTLTLAGMNMYTGGTDVDGGKLIIADTLALPPISVVTLSAGSIESANGVVLAGTISASVAFDWYFGAVSANLSGAVSLNKRGAGTLDLYGVNTYTGGTYVYEGTLVIHGLQALPAGGALVIFPGATLVLASGLGLP